MEEIWKPVIGFNYYLISNLGRVKRLAKKGSGFYVSVEVIMKIFKCKEGYMVLGMTNSNGRRVNKSIHRLLAENFIPNPENKRCVNHKNGIRDDNRLDNLEWMTHSENSKHGYDFNGVENPSRLLTNDQVKEIKIRLLNFKAGMLKEIGDEYGVNKSVISFIKQGRTYKKVTI